MQFTLEELFGWKTTSCTTRLNWAYDEMAEMAFPLNLDPSVIGGEKVRISKKWLLINCISSVATFLGRRNNQRK